MQFRQVDRERLENIWQIFVECTKMMGERHFWQKFFFTTNCCNGQTQSNFGDIAQNFLSECQKKIAQVSMKSKKEPIRRKVSSTDLLDNWYAVLTKLLFMVRQKKPLIVRSKSEKDEKTYKKVSKQMFVFKLILRACRKQFRQLGWKNFEQRPIILRSMSKNDGKKIFWRKEFHHKLVQLTNRKQYWQRDRQTSVEMTKNCRSMPNDEKEEKLCQKKFSAKHPLGYVVSRID